MASDDPEAWDFFNSTTRTPRRPDIHILNNFNNVGAIEVNAFQSHSDVLIRSHARGLGLTVSEAIWKAGRSSAATSVASADRSRTGSTASCVERRRLRAAHDRVLSDPKLGHTLGRRGKEHVRQHFLTPRYSHSNPRIFNEPDKS